MCMRHSVSSSLSCSPSKLCGEGRQRHGPCQRQRRRGAPCEAFQVKPYKLKNGETLEQVANSHDLETQELLALNHELDPADADASPTILVPHGRMSDADRAILHGMKDRQYRTYALKRHESLEDVLGAREIGVEEFARLNPDVDPDNLAVHEVVKLPAHKYSPHEELEMHGALGSPQSFSLGSWAMNALIFGTLAISGYSAFLYREGKKARKAAELEGKIAAARKRYKVPDDLPTPSYLASVDGGPEGMEVEDAEGAGGGGGGIAEAE